MPSGVVVSTYTVDCSRVNLYAAYSEARSAPWAAGTLDGFESAWIHSRSGGQIYPCGYDDMRMSPGMQLRYDAERGTVYTASDLRFLTSGDTLPRVYRVHVVGDRTYSAPAGW